MWSLGLVATKLATGYPLYHGHMDYNMLSFMIETQGQSADDVLDHMMGIGCYIRKQSNGSRFKTPEEFAY